MGQVKVINHGYEDIKEYIEDIHAAIPYFKLNYSHKLWHYIPSQLNYEINKPNYLLVGWRLHFIRENNEQHYLRRETHGAPIEEWFLRDVPFKSHIQTALPKRRNEYSKPLTDIKIWGEFDNSALPYIVYNKEFMKYCIEQKRSCHRLMPLDIKQEFTPPQFVRKGKEFEVAIKKENFETYQKLSQEIATGPRAYCSVPYLD